MDYKETYQAWLDAKELDPALREELLAIADDPAQQEEMAQQCSRILAYMDKLAEVDTTGVDPLYSPVFHECAFRDDTAVRRCSRADILAGAPATDGTFFIVPRIVEGK